MYRDYIFVYVFQFLKCRLEYEYGTATLTVKMEDWNKIFKEALEKPEEYIKVLMTLSEWYFPYQSIVISFQTNSLHKIKTFHSLV